MSPRGAPAREATETDDREDEMTGSRRKTPRSNETDIVSKVLDKRNILRAATLSTLLWLYASS